MLITVIILLGLFNANDGEIKQQEQETDIYNMVDVKEEKIIPRTLILTANDDENIDLVHFTLDELNMLYYIVEREAQDLSMDHKRIITNVILNRVKAPYFPDTIGEVIHQDGQFASLHNIYDKSRVPTQETKVAVSEALLGLIEDNSQGALYFCNLSLVKNIYTVNWFNSMEKLFDLEGHSFFR